MSTNSDRKGRTKTKGEAQRKGKNRRGVTVEDGVRAAVIAAALTASAAILSLLIILLKQTPPFPDPGVGDPGVSPPAQVVAVDPEFPPLTVPEGVSQAPPFEKPPPIPVPRPGLTPGYPERSPAPIPRALPLAPTSVPQRAPPEPPPKPRGMIAFVIDDAGNNLRELEPFLRFPGPLTIAVLPGLPHSKEAARRVRAAGKEVILHQPMEALGGQNPGPGAIYVDMDAAEVRRILTKNLQEIGPVSGMNNHQGSKVTMDEGIMETVLAFCRENGIYFLDSRTTAESVVPAVAARMGIRIRERDVFVDNIQEKAVMVRFIQDGMRKAERQGAAVMIGHVWSSELAATLEELYPELVEEGFSLATISKIMMGALDDDEDIGY